MLVEKHLSNEQEDGFAIFIFLSILDSPLASAGAVIASRTEILAQADIIVSMSIPCRADITAVSQRTITDCEKV